MLAHSRVPAIIVMAAIEWPVQRCAASTISSLHVSALTKRCARYSALFPIMFLFYGCHRLVYKMLLLRIHFSFFFSKSGEREKKPEKKHTAHTLEMFCQPISVGIFATVLFIFVGIIAKQMATIRMNVTSTTDTWIPNGAQHTQKKRGESK